MPTGPTTVSPLVTYQSAGVAAESRCSVKIIEFLSSYCFDKQPTPAPRFAIVPEMLPRGQEFESWTPFTRCPRQSAC